MSDLRSGVYHEIAITAHCGVSEDLFFFAKPPKWKEQRTTGRLLRETKCFFESKSSHVESISWRLKDLTEAAVTIEKWGT